MPTTTIAGRGPNNSTKEVAVDADGKLIISGDITIGDITLDNVEISNDDGNPIPVNGTVALGAGSATIGKLGANSGVDIGDVDVTSLPAIPAGTNLIGKVGSDTSGTATLSNVAASASNVTVLASNASRKRVVIVNDSTATLYLKFGATASATSYTYILYGGDTYESPSNPIYTGQIDGIWASATGAARVTEMT